MISSSQKLGSSVQESVPAWKTWAWSLPIGVALLMAASHIQVNLPWTPVPVTGQTFAVALIGLLWGARQGAAILMTYLAAGLLGAPAFAVVTGWATAGYLIGMVLSVIWTGGLTDRGWAKGGVFRRWAAAITGDVWTLGVGWLWLSQSLGARSAFFLGVLPFIPGELIKSSMAATIATGIRRD